MLQRIDVDLVHAAAAGEIECVRSGCAYRHARPHHAHAGERGLVGVDAAAGGDDVVGFLRRKAAERHVVDVVPVENVPVMAGAMVSQFDRPCRAADGVVELLAGAHVVDGELLTPDDPTGLAETRKAIGADARLAEAL